MTEQAVNTVALPCPADRLVPHRPPMLIVRELLERQGDTALVAAQVPAAGIWVNQGGVLPEYYVELVAQAIAAANGYDALQEGKPPANGFLVGVDEFHWLAAAAPGERLLVTVEKTFEFGAVKIIRGTVRNDAGIKADGEIKVWLAAATEGSR